MRYHASISIQYVAPATYPEPARESLAAEITTQLEAQHPGSMTGLDVTVRYRSTVVVDATISGTSPRDLTSPLDALSRLDACLLWAFAVVGQFEEFDIARRTLAARPA